MYRKIGRNTILHFLSNLEQGIKGEQREISNVKDLLKKSYENQLC